MANLSRMEPVRVYHHMLPAGTGAGTQNHVRELFESRARSEDEAAGVRTPRNRLHVGSLVALLGECQSRDATTTMRQVAEKYGMDVERVERLVRVVNVPSVREGGETMFVWDAESGADVVVTEVEWREPSMVTAK